jgi:hypothetical protein
MIQPTTVALGDARINWTGFQIHDPETKDGHLTLCRELLAESGG